MITHPFSILRPFDNRLSVALLTKSDDMNDDAAAAGMIGAPRAAGLWQMHGARTVVIRDASDRTEQADGMITDMSGLALCIRAADCQNFVIYVPEKNILGALHVGWKGLIAGAIPEFFRVLNKEFGVDASEAFVGAGPSLCMQCADFTDPQKELPSVSPAFIHGRHADLQAAATAQLLALGVRREHLERHPDCTRCHPETWWTYRGGDREAVKKGHTNVLVCALR